MSRFVLHPEALPLFRARSVWEAGPFYAVAGIFTFSARDSRIRSFSLALSVGFVSSEDGEEHHNSECA
jgi:hypothetical protein